MGFSSQHEKQMVGLLVSVVYWLVGLSTKHGKNRGWFVGFPTDWPPPLKRQALQMAVSGLEDPALYIRLGNLGWERLHGGFHSHGGTMGYP